MYVGEVPCCAGVGWAGMGGRDERVDGRPAVVMHRVVAAREDWVVGGVNGLLAVREISFPKLRKIRRDKVELRRPYVSMFGRWAVVKRLIPW